VAAVFSRAGRFKRRNTPGAERELKRVQAKVGELTMKLEIVEWFVEKSSSQNSEEGGAEFEEEVAVVLMTLTLLLMPSSRLV
jgi:hypothetical protein